MEPEPIIDMFEETDDMLDAHPVADMVRENRICEITESSEEDFINCQGEYGWTALMYETNHSNLEAVTFLLEEGAKTDIKNSNGHTALILAAKNGSGDIVNILIHKGASINDRDLRGWTALFHATAFGRKDTVELLIERGALVDIVDNGGMTPLMIAATGGYDLIVKSFLKLGINVNIACKSGETAMSLARKNGHKNVINLIDSYIRSNRINVGPKQSHSLASVLEDLNLSKYYHLFEKRGIDLNTFWHLSDNDLVTIGIKLLGPRKKLSNAIAQHHLDQFDEILPNAAINRGSIHKEDKEKTPLITDYLEKPPEEIIPDAAMDLNNLYAENEKMPILIQSYHVEQSEEIIPDEILNLSGLNIKDEEMPLLIDESGESGSIDEYILQLFSGHEREEYKMDEV